MNQDQQALRATIKNTWWAVLLTGIMGALIGLLILTHPQGTLAALAQLFGIAWLTVGALHIGTSFMGGDGWGFRLVSGVIGMLAGFFVLANPLFAGAVGPVVLVYVLGFATLISGVSEMVVGRRIGGLGMKWSWGSFFHGLILVLLGGFLLANSLFSVSVVVSVTGAMAMIWGIGLVIYSFQIRAAVQTD